jgi:hypothetical protein
MRLLRRRPPEPAEPGGFDRVIVDRQRQLLAEREARIEELEFELEAAQLLGDRDLVVDAHRYLTTTYRAQVGFLRSQLQLAFEILEARKRREATS